MKLYLTIMSKTHMFVRQSIKNKQNIETMKNQASIIKIETFEIFEDSYKVEYSIENKGGKFLTDDTEVWIRSIQPAPEMEDIKWVLEMLEDKVRFHELEVRHSELEFQAEARGDELYRGN